VTNPHPPTAAQWTPPPAPNRPRVSGGLVIALAVVGLIASAALVVGIIGLARPTSTSGGNPATTTSAVAPTSTPDQVASAKKNLCSVYQVASRSVKQDTNGGDTAVARVSLTNAAGMLDAAADNPALGGTERDAARTLAFSYRDVVAVGSVFERTSPVGQASLDDANRADAAMAALCP
jgi:hypothetical protein